MSATVLAVSGNPRPASRTLHAARVAADAVAGVLGGRTLPALDLADLAPSLFAPQRDAVDAALTTLAGADVAVVATPVYKASYTGLLKSFLDLYGNDGLAGVVAVPLVVSGSPAHALVGDVHLRALLVELGAVVPTRALALTEAQLGDGLVAAVGAWLSRARGALGAAASHPQELAVSR